MLQWIAVHLGGRRDYESRFLLLREAERLMRSERSHLQRGNGQQEVVDWARRARPVQDEIHRAVDVDIVGDIVFDQCEIAVTQVRDVRDVPGQKVVDPDHCVAAIEQGFGQMRADEPGCSSDHDTLFHTDLGESRNARVRLVRVFVEEAVDDGQPHDLEIESY